MKNNHNKCKKLKQSHPNLKPNKIYPGYLCHIIFFKINMSFHCHYFKHQAQLNFYV